MKLKILLILCAALFAAPTISSAATVACLVNPGTVLNSTFGGFGYSINNGVGTSTGGATGFISCPTISELLPIQNYRVLVNASYSGGPTGTTSGTRVDQLFTLVGGSLNGASLLASISGGETPTSVVPPVPFQIGATLSGANSYGGFTVRVSSSVFEGGPVAFSTGQVVIQYNQEIVAPVPEPSSYALLLTGLTGLGWFSRRRSSR